jgi:uncharacterized protein (AIM24 family)
LHREAAASDLISGVSPAAALAVAHFLAVKSYRVCVCGPDWKTGEDSVLGFTGPGRLWTQSRNHEEPVTWLTAELPFSRS